MEVFQTGSKMITQLRGKRLLIAVILAMGFFMVSTTHSGAMDLNMAAMGDCSVAIHCCDCTVPEIPSFFEPEFHPYLIGLLPQSSVSCLPIQSRPIFHPPK